MTKWKSGEVPGRVCAGLSTWMRPFISSGASIETYLRDVEKVLGDATWAMVVLDCLKDFAVAGVAETKGLNYLWLQGPATTVAARHPQEDLAKMPSMLRSAIHDFPAYRQDILVLEPTDPAKISAAFETKRVHVNNDLARFLGVFDSCVDSDVTGFESCTDPNTVEELRFPDAPLELETRAFPSKAGNKLRPADAVPIYFAEYFLAITTANDLCWVSPGLNYAVFVDRSVEEVIELFARHLEGHGVFAPYDV